MSEERRAGMNGDFARTGDSPPSSGWVRAAVAPLLAEPRISSEQISQLVRGQEFRVVAPSGDWLRVRGVDRYSGWVHQGYLSPTTGAEVRPAISGISLGCEILSRRGRLRLPLGAHLFEDEETTAGSHVTIAQLRARFPAEPAAVVETARSCFGGTPYQWGGVTDWGADCSGFVQAVFRLHGVELPRDAREQGTAGEESGSDPASNVSGELLFFSERSDGRITHVGIALGGGEMAHVSLGRGGFAIESFTAPAGGDERLRQLRSNFRFARTVLG